MNEYNILISERLLFVIDAFLEACERFWDNRFKNTDNEVIWLRGELDKARQEYYNLAKLFNQNRKETIEPEVDYSEMKPLGGRPHWRVQASKLEENSRKEREAQKRRQSDASPDVITTPQTTAELEEELLPEIK